MERGVIPGQEQEEFQLLPPAAPPAGPEVGQGLAGPAEVAAASGVTCQAAPGSGQGEPLLLVRTSKVGPRMQLFTRWQRLGLHRGGRGLL